MEVRWEDDAVSGPLLRKLLAASDYSSWETRAFLRPIFRWMKVGLHKDGSREREAIERAFAFVEWLVLLATQGDASRGIPKLPTLQPSYALNTIVTASQRAGSVEEAQRAFDLLETHGYQPDVFTYTALIDVIARNGDLPAAIAKYEEMRLSTSKPNVVTYTTLVRAVGLSDSVGAEQCLVFLAHAREEGAFDEALFLEALETCARRKDRAVATRVLEEIATHSPKLRADDRFFHTVGQVAKLLDYDGLEPVLDMWGRSGVLGAEERARVVQLQLEDGASAADGSKTLGCLGHQTSQSVRKAVVHHDINRLIARIQSGSIVNVNDFETLIHQCRKRKWKEDVAVIVDAMRDLATKGWQPDSEDDGNAGEPIPPQPHLQPTSKTYVSIVDAYMCCGDERLAWQIVQDIEDLPEITRELALYRKFVRGAYLLTNCDHIAELIALAHEDKVVFAQRMGVEVARMFGYRHVEGFNLLVHELPIGEPGAQAKRQGILEELVKSCAFKNSSTGAEETLQAMLKHGFERTATTEIALFMCCIQRDTVLEAQTMLQHFQEASLMLPVPVYDSLLREFYFKFTRRGNTFDESSRKVAMKTLYARRAIFEQVFKDREALAAERKIALISGPDQDFASFSYWCSRSSLSCSPLMFSQHAMQVLTTSRDKDSKSAAEQSIRDALMVTPDPCLFLLRSVVSLRFLDLTFRTLGKLAKQLLVVVTEELPMEERHAEYCVSQLPLLSVHIVKELDDVVYLHRSHRTELLAFCQDALDTNSVDKTLGFLMRRPELYDTETAACLGPKFAEMFVFGGVNNVLTFFKADMEDSLEVRRQFVREVIELENADAEEEGEDDDSCSFGYTYKAIREFKLEHEAEFMPYMMQARAAMPKPVYADASATPADETAYLKISLALDHIVVVDSDETLSLATDLLMRDCVTRLGLDAEWRPDSRAVVPSKCSILQVACDDYVFIFDFVEVALGDLEELFEHLFSSEKIAKIGFAIDGDIKRLRWSFPEVKCFDTFVNILDFSFETLVATTHLADGTIVATHSSDSLSTENLQRRRRRQKGLSTYIKQALEYPLSKLQQKSDWARRPLTQQQVAYAALDAYCLLMLQDAVANK
ncbi:Exonuclease mut-7 [Phytophthora pseudosyringae]|uniref:Exonuclease mut-7 n=1 Tax=Phytophthora pseudosyringae TaxID=221518 RepID=A0A8T1VBW1_9STRA|nr:Exonuclease mut-7 [Phytophthora pseudosyringae]